MNPDAILWFFLVLMAGYLGLAILLFFTEVHLPRWRRNRQTRQIDAWLRRRDEREVRQRL